MTTSPELKPVLIAQDRVFSVPPGHRVVTGYVNADDVVLACKAPMAAAAVEEKMRLFMQAAPAQPFPCPNGHWRDDGRFVVRDGRHAARAVQLLGWSHLLVAWLEAC